MTEKDMDDFCHKVARQIASIRKRQGLSQTDLANKIGLQYKSTIAGAECGYKNVRYNLKHIYLISIALKTDVSEFFKID